MVSIVSILYTRACAIRWVVEHAVQVVLIVAEVIRVAIVNFTNCVDTGSLFEWLIEGFINGLGRVNSKAIDWRVLAKGHASDVPSTY